MFDVTNYSLLAIVCQLLFASNGMMNVRLLLTVWREFFTLASRLTRDKPPEICYLKFGDYTALRACAARVGRLK